MSFIVGLGLILLGALLGMFVMALLCVERRDDDEDRDAN
jgi:hypothetical protein